MAIGGGPIGGQPISGFGPISGVLDVLEANDTLVSTGVLAINGTLSITEANDTLASTGVLLIAGALSVTEQNDTLVATGALSITGVLSITEDNDTLVATGTVTAAGGGDIIRHGGVRPYYDVVVVGWGAIRAFPQVTFDFVLELPPRGLSQPVENPVIAPTPVSDKEKLSRYAEAAAAFDLELVRKYLEAVGIT